MVKIALAKSLIKGCCSAYIEKILGFVNLQSLVPIKTVINSGNGTAGPTVDALIRKLEERGVKTNFFCIQHNPDSSFPNGIPNLSKKIESQRRMPSG